MSMVEVRECTLDDLRIIAENLRDQDAVEMSMLSKEHIVDAVVESYESSKLALGIFVDGTPAGVFGLGEVTPEIGAPWMLGTDLLVKHSRPWLKAAPTMRDSFLTQYPTLINMIHKKNTRSKKWLKKLGFEFLPDSIPGFPDFTYFIRTRQDV